MRLWASFIERSDHLKRSTINAILVEGLEFIAEMNFKLPPFAHWSLDDWKLRGEEYQEIKDNMLGWDITDFGSGNFAQCGLLLFTIRNGNPNLAEYKKAYAEKILIVDEGQLTPYHYHVNKMEDIINRGGGNLLVQLYNSTPDNQLADTAVRIATDGRNYEASAGTIVRLAPGESITLFPRVFHQFRAEEGQGKVLVGEVSNVNDDITDNHFLEARGRFPEIIEDAPPTRLLVVDY